ncbi:MAG: PKD domain-containing protein, partial [Bacteroidetes bacterium]|nr:PKD domain-containing protein [Bacteroidota bacterium]
MYRYFRSTSLILLIAGSAIAHNTTVFFTENHTQWHEQVRFKADIPGGSIFLQNNQFTYVFHNGILEHKREGEPIDTLVHYHAFRTSFLGANAKPLLTGKEQLPGIRNYFLGRDRSKWSSGVKSYREVEYRGLYPGIDLRIYGIGDGLKYDLIISPGADVSKLKILYEGLDDLSLTPAGNLRMLTSLNEVIEQAPIAYQEGEKVACHFVLKKNKVRFEFPEGYDKSKELVIDPTLIFSTYSGSSTDNWGSTATYDVYGNAYAGGIVFGQTTFPSVIGGYDSTYNGNPMDILISKYDPTGAIMRYATYIGGSGAEFPHSLIVNFKDELIILGTTSSANFPVSSNAYDTTFNGG